MKYLVYDLEFNQYFPLNDENKEDNSNEVKTSHACPFEIIQIGAILLDEELNEIDTFCRFVNPSIYLKLHPYVERITNISIENLLAEESFPKVFEAFSNLINKENTILCTWGNSDIKELKRNMRYHNISTDILPTHYFNIQKFASKYFQCKKGITIGLKTAIDELGLSDSLSFHDAYNDAIYTSRILKKICNEKIIKENLRTIVENRRKPPLCLDKNALFLQFEKILNRSLTNEEMKIIYIAYNMGKSNQFLKEK